jgi:hypothetical protein
MKIRVIAPVAITSLHSVDETEVPWLVDSKVATVSILDYRLRHSVRLRWTFGSTLHRPDYHMDAWPR